MDRNNNDKDNYNPTKGEKYNNNNDVNTCNNLINS